MKRFNEITCVIDTNLKTSTVIAGGVSMAVFAIGTNISVGIALNGTSLLFSLVSAITQKSFKYL